MAKRRGLSTRQQHAAFEAAWAKAKRTAVFVDEAEARKWFAIGWNVARNINKAPKKEPK